MSIQITADKKITMLKIESTVDFHKKILCIYILITELMSSILYKRKVSISISLLFLPFYNQVVEW